ncbi:methylcobalamin:coenzyme M methyltransferase [Peptococcaceae bacterium CEB3]|nr:methylcobalamin:coenzyme M methyltransferase [Peptococcaceae bacterium CEB3]
MVNSRERVRLALAHREADRVPIDNGGIVSGMHEAAYVKLAQFLGFEAQVSVYDPIQRLVTVEEPILERLHVDTRYLYANAGADWEYREDEEGFWTDEWGVKHHHVGYYADSVEHPLAGMSLEDLKAYKFPDPQDPARFAGLREKALELSEKTEYALVGGTIGALYAPAWDLRGYEQFMFDTVADPAFSEYLLDKLLDWWMAFYESYLAAIGDKIEYLWTGDDWGQQSGPLISPASFRRTVKPRFAQLHAFIKSKTKAKIAYHSCGSVYWALRDFAEMGVDIVQPLQPSASEMDDAERIKREFGGILVLHGGTDNQGTFHLDQETVVRDAKRRIAALAPGGGYIFSSGHNIQPNCPPENILALFDTGYEFGRYPIGGQV